MATELEMESFLSLADLTNLPFADESLSVILNLSLIHILPQGENRNG